MSGLGRVRIRERYDDRKLTDQERRILSGVIDARWAGNTLYDNELITYSAARERARAREHGAILALEKAIADHTSACVELALATDALHRYEERVIAVDLKAEAPT